MKRKSKKKEIKNARKSKRGRQNNFIYRLNWNKREVLDDRIIILLNPNKMEVSLENGQLLDLMKEISMKQMQKKIKRKQKKKNKDK